MKKLMKLKPMSAAERRAYNLGIKVAASLAGGYDGASTHEYRLEDCILRKLNVPGAPKPRKNKRRVEDPKKALVQGIALGLSEASYAGASDSVLAAAQACGLTLASAKAAGVESFDLKRLRKAGIR